MSEYWQLPPQMRAKRYRELADDARREAANARGDTRDSYQAIAEQWDKLAEDLEKRAKKTNGH
ncbi:MAG TPA: hypothetical protein VEU06_08360 [Micropepsaceae bacterium]|nr:hypothetical protein [Micropepsaceae bacterium]